MSDSDFRVMVLGNPNVGKTSLFNVLTGLRQRVGNYSGVTVERRAGRLAARFRENRRPLELIDLPGIYSLTPSSADEGIALEALDDERAPPDAVLLVLDASNLARNLYLALQVLEAGCSLVVALNMVDLAHKAGIPVDPEALAARLGVPVVATVARTGDGVAELVHALQRVLADESRPPPVLAPLGPDDESLREVLESLEATGLSPVQARRSIVATMVGYGADPPKNSAVAEPPPTQLRTAVEQLVHVRYRYVDAILRGLDHQSQLLDRAPTMGLSQRIDRVLTHRVWGMFAFVGLMALVFISIFSWADPIMGLIEEIFGALSTMVSDRLGPGLLTELITEGLIAGVGNVVVFVPQIAFLFLFLGLLEDSGYLARAAFLLDRLMARLGLHGRAFIPLLSGYACAIPAILGARTISSPRDRIVTILMIPFMSCSARLPIYTLVIGALFINSDPVFTESIDQGLVLLGMYMLSTVSALVMGFIYKRTLLRGPTPPLVLELPPYRLPRIRDTLLVVAQRVKDFLSSAMTIILAMTIVLWALLSFPADRTGAGRGGPTDVGRSYGGQAAQMLEPMLEPIGQDWRMGVGILGSFAAREVLVSTLGLVYGMEADDEDPVQLRQALREQVNPRTGEPQHTPLSGLALMVFFVYACQCMSTLAVVRRETGGWRWPLFMFISMTSVAYVAALVVFQGGRLLGWG